LISILSDDINQLERFLDVGANDLIQVSTTVVVVGVLSLFWPRCGMDGNAAYAVYPLGFNCLSASPCSPLCGCARKGKSPQLSAGKQSDGITTIKSFTAENYEAARLAVDSLSAK